MSTAPLPPYGAPRGPRTDDATLISAFAAGSGTGHSDRLHIEGSVLAAGDAEPAALRLGAGIALVRRDLPDDLGWARPVVESGLAGTGLESLDEATLLATPVALQVVGLRLSVWDLWGTDVDRAFTALRAAAAGEGDAGVHG